MTGSILPKTLFGEKYVSLLVPDGSASPRARETRWRPGTRSSAPRSRSRSRRCSPTSTPPARRPARRPQLHLNALATALDGRGEAIGENLETLDGYLKRLNPRIPALLEDLRLTATVSDVYSDVLPEIGQTLRNTIVTAQTLEGRDKKLRAMFSDVAAFADTSRVFLDENGDNIIRLEPALRGPAAGAGQVRPGVPCLLGGIVKAGSFQAEAFRGFTLHIVLETLPNQPRGYDAGDVPRLADKRGPHCGGLPNPPWSQKNVYKGQPNFNDGVDRPTGKGTSRVGPALDARRPGSGFVGSPSESALINALVGPSLGLAPDDVDPLGSLLVGPLVRGEGVSLR